MRLSVEETLRNLKQVEEKYKIRFTPTGEVNISEMAQDCIDTIEALQQENEQLKADCDRMLGEVQELTMESNRFKERLQISPYGDDKIDELDEALENCKFQYEQLKLENERLRAQVAQMRKALELCSWYGSEGLCIDEKLARKIMKALRPDSGTDYHNPTKRR